MNTPLRKFIDSDKVRKYFEEHPELVKNEISRKACVNKSIIHDAIRRGEVRTVFWNSICDALNVPRDYFDYVEPETIEITPIEYVNTHSNDTEELKDLLVSLLATGKNIEGLLLKQNKLIEEIKKDTPSEQWNRLISHQ